MRIIKIYSCASSRRAMVVPVSTSVASIEQSGDAVRIAENTYITKKHKLEIPENILKNTYCHSFGSQMHKAN